MGVLCEMLYVFVGLPLFFVVLFWKICIFACCLGRNLGVLRNG